VGESLARMGHQLKLLRGGTAFFPAMIEAIDSGVHEVRLETYIFHFDGAGASIAAALERAAQRGLAVYLAMDGIGTPEVPLEWQQRFDAAGVLWHLFSPLGRWGLLKPPRWRRLHRKLCIVDARIAFCGGINILDDWYDPYFGSLDSPRFDFAVQVEGPLVADIQHVMSQFWRRLKRNRTERRASWLADIIVGRKSSGGTPNGPESVGAQAVLVLRDNLLNRTRIERAYRRAIGDARQEIVIANAYFLPAAKISRSLVHAARRGVRVRLLLQGRYENFMQFHASRPMLGALLAAGVEVHEYTAGFLHAKVAVVDRHWATVGSSNLDPLSLLLAREANVVVHDSAFAQELRECMEQAIDESSVRLDAKAYAQRPWRWRILDWIAFGLMQALLFLTGRRY